MKQKKYILAHKEDDAGLLTIGINQKGFSQRLVFDYLNIPLFNDHFLTFRNGYIEWFCNKQIWDKMITIVMNRINNDKNLGSKIWSKTIEIKKELEKESSKTLENLKKHNLVFKDWQKIINLMHQMFSIGVVPPISDIQHFSFTKLMEEIIAKKIEQLKLKRPIGDYFSVLTTPTQENLFQKNEKELLKIAKEKTDQKIEDYLEKYRWIEYGHLGPALTANKVKEKLNKLVSRKNTLAKNQKKYIAELKLTSKEKQLFKTARDFGQHKACRLAMAYLINYMVNCALKILAKKYNYTIQELRNLNMNEFLTMIKSNKKVSRTVLKQRQKFCVNHVVSYEKVKTYINKDARDFIRKYMPKEDAHASQQIIKGNIACAGKAVGKVKIITSSKDMKKMNQGDILVAVQTMPQLLPAMKKAAAIITDIGGLVCHTAIVARELNTPCIIGTWNATKILKDEDLVEVNADKGIVKIL